MSVKKAAERVLNRMVKKVSSAFKRHDTPREIQERKDLYMALIASKYKSLRFPNTNDIHSGNYRESLDIGKTINPSLFERDKEKMELLIEEATQKLETDLVHQMTIRELRVHLQNELAPDVKRVFQAFSNAEKQLSSSSSQSSSLQSQSMNNHQLHNSSIGLHKLNKQTKDDNKMKTILLKNFDDLSYFLFHHDSSQFSSSRSNLPFHITKLSALKTLLDYKNWISPTSLNSHYVSEDNISSRLSSTTTSSLPLGTIDEFGYCSLDDNANVKQIMRNNQVINLSYTNIIKQILGYSSLALKSSIPGAGRGIYIDGFASAGSIVAFFPGEVWAREHLQNKMIASHFADDDDYQLSLRYDDILIDSRKSPAVVLDTERSNPWAIAHLANHPPNPNLASDQTIQTNSNSVDNKTTQPLNTNIASIPNCRPLSINYTEEMKLNKELKTFVPNRYARKPPMLGYNEAFERQAVFMHGMVLVATRDVENEELFYDYRLSELESTKHPDWYHVCDADAMKNRWT